MVHAQNLLACDLREDYHNAPCSKDKLGESGENAPPKVILVEKQVRRFKSHVSVLLYSFQILQNENWFKMKLLKQLKEKNPCGIPILYFISE